MGASKSQGTVTDPTIEAEQFNQLNNCGMYRNKQGKQFEKYRVQNYGFNDFVSKYEYRIRNPNQFLVNAYWIGEFGNTFGCSVTDLYDVVIERVHSRLSDLINLSWYESTNMLRGALKGFQQLYNKVGLFLVKDTMIGLDKDNQVKVWLNPKFQLNSLETQPVSYTLINEEEREQAMIENIFQLIQIRSKRQEIWLKFVREWKKIKPNTFRYAIQFVENFIQLNHRIPVRYQQNSMENTSRYSANFQLSSKQQNKNKTLSQTQTQSRSQSQSLIQYQPHILLTKSIDMRHNGVEDNSRNYMNHNQVKAQGFASLRNRAIQNTVVNNGRSNHHQPIHPHNIDQQQHHMPVMPSILQNRHQRTHEIKAIPIASRINFQGPVKNLSQSCEILPIMRQPLFTQMRPIITPILQTLQTNIVRNVNQVSLRPVSQQKRFPEPRQAVQIIKPNKSSSRLTLQKKQIDKQPNISPHNIQQQKQLLPILPTPPSLSSQTIISNNSQLIINSQLKSIPKQAINKEVMTQSRKLKRQPGRIKYKNQKLAESRKSVLNCQSNPEISRQIARSQETKIQNINYDCKNQAINSVVNTHTVSSKSNANQQHQQQKQSIPEFAVRVIQAPREPKTNSYQQSTKQEQIPQQIKKVGSTHIIDPPQKLQRSLSTSIKMIQDIEKKMEMSRVSRLSRTNSEVSNSISYSDLRSLLKSVHRKNKN